MDSTVLDGENYLNLVTFKRDGSGVETPVWFANIGGLLYVFTAGDAYKVKRLRGDARIRNLHHADVRLHRAVRAGMRVASRDGVEQRRLA
ncbi:MAG: hypothetical protein ACE5D3_09040 [Candidatus Binatia bacterium]